MALADVRFKEVGALPLGRRGKGIAPTALPQLTLVVRYFDEYGRVQVLWPLKNGRPAHLLTREDRAKGGRIRAAKARERRDSLRYERRGSKRLEEAAERLGELLRSSNIETAMWADSVIKRHLLPESSKHLDFPYWTKPYD